VSSSSRRFLTTPAVDLGAGKPLVRALLLRRSTGRSAVTRLAALPRFAPRPLVLDLSDQVSAHLREGMIKVALVGRSHEVSPSR
jgi:hypothetical protein